MLKPENISIQNRCRNTGNLARWYPNKWGHETNPSRSFKNDGPNDFLLVTKLPWYITVSVFKPDDPPSSCLEVIIETHRPLTVAPISCIFQKKHTYIIIIDSCTHTTAFVYSCIVIQLYIVHNWTALYLMSLLCMPVVTWWNESRCVLFDS